MLTNPCKYCYELFEVKNINDIFCSEQCRKLSLSGYNRNRKCVICHNVFDSFQESITCSPKCLQSYIKAFEPSVLGTCSLCENKAIVDSNGLLLCQSCNTNDSFFTRIVQAALASGTRVVKKGWGLEVHIVNHDKYCLKYLIFFKGKKFSYHYHRLKQECWHCLCGSFDMILTIDEWTRKISYRSGQVIEILPGQVHQLFAREDSILVEVSTRDFPEDSIRIEKGD